MANYFGISKSDLVENHSSETKEKRGVTIKVYGRVAAGIPIEMIEDVVDAEEISQEMAKTGHRNSNCKWNRCDLQTFKKIPWRYRTYSYESKLWAKIFYW